MGLFVTFLVAVSLSMDAFSLSLAYGTLGICKREKYVLSITTGVFHFFMPIFGFLFGNFLMKFINIDTNLIVSIILSFIGIEMVITSFGKKEVKNITGFGYLLFAFAVSIDSFSVGITLSSLLGPILFSLSSFIFTFLGLSLGGKIENYFGKVSTIVGGLTLIVIGLCYMLQ